MGQPRKKKPTIAVTASEEFPLQITSGRPFQESCANFQRTNNFEGRLPDIRFPALARRGTKPEVVQAKLLELPYGSTEADALAVIGATGWKPAEPEHLLAWGLATSIPAQTWKNTLGLGKQKTRITSGFYTGKGPFRVFLELNPNIQDVTAYLGGSENRYLVVQ